MFSKDQSYAWNCKMNTIDKDDNGEAKIHPQGMPKRDEKNESIKSTRKSNPLRWGALKKLKKEVPWLRLVP